MNYLNICILLIIGIKSFVLKCCDFGICFFFCMLYWMLVILVGLFLGIWFLIIFVVEVSFCLFFDVIIILYFKS